MTKKQNDHPDNLLDDHTMTLTVTRPAKSKEQQLCEQPAPIRGATALRVAKAHSRSSSSPPLSEEQQPQEQTAQIRGVAALCSTHQSEEQSHNSLHLSNEQQPVLGAVAPQAAHHIRGTTAACSQPPFKDQQPPKEVEVVLETSEVVVEGVLVGMTTLVMEETSVVEVALVAAMVVMDMVALGMAIRDLVMMEAILEVVEATMILEITKINIQILGL
ncbi:hypothetical protein MDA_GLEAN10002191 [Myotis davidii]|uniref:Uncharacterized protein n=1 Tax=Myotis davidii TaxID=225400 RepID=L5MH07_MYODS|nr:hypothetical protein MDA_GLEAN10002191 [Myotis davidii]